MASVWGLLAAPVAWDTDPPWTLAAFLVLDELAPVLVLAPALAALLAGVAAPLVRLDLPRWRMQVRLALAGVVAALAPGVPSIVSVYDTMHGLAGGRRTVLTLALGVRCGRWRRSQCSRARFSPGRLPHAPLASQC